MAASYSSDFPPGSQGSVSCPVPVYRELAGLSFRLGELVEALGGGNAPAREPSRTQDGEYRTFYLSPSALAVEKAMLRQHHAQNLTDLMVTACATLETQSRLLLLVQPEETVSAFFVQQLGTILLDICTKMQNASEVLNGMKLVGVSESDSFEAARGAPLPDQDT